MCKVSVHGFYMEICMWGPLGKVSCGAHTRWDPQGLNMGKQHRHFIIIIHLIDINIIFLMS